MSKRVTAEEAKQMADQNAQGKKPEEKIVGEVDLDLNLQLPKDAKWVCMGKKADGQVALFIPYIGKWDGDELTGFIQRAADPKVLVETINETLKKTR